MKDLHIDMQTFININIAQAYEITKISKRIEDSILKEVCKTYK